MTIEGGFSQHVSHCFREEAGKSNTVDLMGAKCLLYRLTGKNVKRREIYEAGQHLKVNDMDRITIEEFEIIVKNIREKQFITDSTLVNNLYGALDEGQKGYVDESRLAKCMIRAKCPIMASLRANSVFTQLDELKIGKTSITQVHSILESGAS